MTAAGAKGSFWWCVHHQRVEDDQHGCQAEERLGPYESEEAARHWRDRLEARDEKWAKEDKEWSGEE